MFIIRFKKNGRNKFARQKDGKICEFNHKEQARQYRRNHLMYEEDVKILPAGLEK